MGVVISGGNVDVDTFLKLTNDSDERLVRGVAKDKGDSIPQTSPPQRPYTAKQVSGSPSAILGESPSWIACKKLLLYIDISGKRVFTLEPLTESYSVMEFDKVVGFALPTTDTTANGDLFLAVGFEDSIMEVNFTKKVIIT